jgi:2-C-methyl-D-erythritol 4-phosphate cytidylyltransferase / 2-C-methyl-D-erythritol 2,4-cyclodiphosphate synthase
VNSIDISQFNLGQTKTMNSPSDGPQDCVALIVSAGRGHRFGGETPKQYLKLSGRSLLAHSIDVLHSHPRIGRIRAVIHPDDQALYADASTGLSLLEPVFGGAERQDSVRLGLESLAEFNPKYVIIHDAVRPFIDHETLDRLFGSLDAGVSGVIPGVLVADTLKRISDNVISDTVDRTNLWRAQTPQAFDFAEILSAHHAVKGQALTDDAAIAEANGIAVTIVEGAEDNFKITAAADLARGEQHILQAGDQHMTRIGTGFDVHRFEAGASVILCGIEIPFEKSLEGHSDADVAMHAITDALLGAVGAGDIGLFFPPSDPQWKNVSSDVFLARAGKEVAERGGRISNIDLTVICEAPRIGPHRDAMRKNIADILNISVDQVNIKGTTTEQLGFTGRREGIAAQAAAAVIV